MKTRIPTPQVRPFNMVEIVIALMIILLVLVGAMGLIPRSMQSTQSAVSRISAADMADQSLNLFATRLETDWNELGKFPEEKYDFSSNGDAQEIFATDNSLFASTSMKVMFAAANENATWLETNNKKGLFKIRHSTFANQTDFEGIATVWYDRPKDIGTLNAADIGDNQVRLNVEVSWPVSMPYAKREKSLYSMRVFKPTSAATESLAVNRTCRSIWGIENDRLRHFDLRDNSSLVSGFQADEGKLVGLQGSANVEAITISADGTTWFINNGEAQGTLYKISVGEIDGRSTDVNAVRIGATGISNSGNDRIVALRVISNRLYGLSYGSKKIYQINTATGATSQIGSLNISGGFNVCGLAVGVGGYVYIAAAGSNNAKVYKMASFPGGALTNVCRVQGSGGLKALTAHPTGYLYSTDGSKWFKTNPFTDSTTAFTASSTIKGMDFNYNYEMNNCGANVICETTGQVTGDVSVNPTGKDDFQFEMIQVDGTHVTRDDLMHNSSYTFEGLVTYLRFKPKATGQQNLTVDGAPFTLDNGMAYTLYSDTPFTIRVYNSNTNGTAMGHWHVDLVDAPLTVSTCNQEI